MTGGKPELGAWKVKKGLKLSWTEGHVWKSEKMSTVDLEEPFEYKMAVIDEHINVISWQQSQNCQFNLAKLKLALRDVEAVKYFSSKGVTPQFNLDRRTKVHLERGGRAGDIAVIQTNYYS
mmetsp:Transcript_1035/g.639  ORF Transcript_1035/g.639 Transcript_1035/m.639 type:complete len:121 (+) Transcript_1035:284-646(+)